MDAGGAPQTGTAAGATSRDSIGTHNKPQLAIQGPQGVAACAGCLQPYHPYHPDQQLALALLPPPGSGPLPRSPSPSPSPAGHPGPTRAYTSPRSAQDPAPTLLLSPYGPQHHHQHHQHHQPGCPAAAAAYAAAGGSHPLAFPGSATPPASSLMEPMRMLALNGAAAARPLAPPAHPDPGPPPAVQYGVGPAAAAAMAAPPPHLYSLPPPPAPLPLSLPEPPQLSYAAQQQQQYHHQAGGLSMLYDETMQEVVLADAVMVKELAKQGHALVPLHDAYRTKLAALQSDVNGALLARREALMQQHARLAARAGEVAAQRAALEREVAVLAEDMVARIRGAESSKQSALGREVAEVGTHLEAIQRLLGDIVAASAAGPVDFLNAYSRLSDSCARLVSRPFKSVVDVAADDLPSEAAVYRDLAAAHEALGQLLGVKDSMISHLLRERDALQDELRQVVERYSSELSALEAQCQGYYQRLLALGDTGGEGPAAAAAGDSPTPTAATAGAGMGSARAEGSRVSLSSARGRGSTSWTQALELEAEAGRRGSGRR
ncbi:hypothetical protein PLESTF_001270100 [Pleodorina starrii]|nr:hypothetical protein PLESTF_001270100 [Pleodorina starrii]